MPKYEQGQISASDYLLLHAAVTTAYLFSSGIFKGWVGMMLLCIKNSNGLLLQIAINGRPLARVVRSQC